MCVFHGVINLGNVFALDGIKNGARRSKRVAHRPNAAIHMCVEFFNIGRLLEYLLAQLSGDG